MITEETSVHTSHTPSANKMTAILTRISPGFSLFTLDFSSTSALILQQKAGFGSIQGDNENFQFNLGAWSRNMDYGLYGRISYQIWLFLLFSAAPSGSDEKHAVLMEDNQSYCHFND